MLVGRTLILEEIVVPVHVCIVLVLSILYHNPRTVRMLGHIVTTNPEFVVVLIVVVGEAYSLICLVEEVRKRSRIISSCLIVSRNCRRVESETSVVVNVCLAVSA